jgi:hypothetical protein
LHLLFTVNEISSLAPSEFSKFLLIFSDLGQRSFPMPRLPELKRESLWHSLLNFYILVYTFCDNTCFKFKKSMSFYVHFPF